MVYRPDLKTYAAGRSVMWQEGYNHLSPPNHTT